MSELLHYLNTSNQSSQKSDHVLFADLAGSTDNLESASLFHSRSTLLAEFEAFRAVNQKMLETFSAEKQTIFREIEIKPLRELTVAPTLLNLDPEDRKYYKLLLKDERNSALLTGIMAGSSAVATLPFLYATARGIGGWAMPAAALLGVASTAISGYMSYGYMQGRFPSTLDGHRISSRQFLESKQLELGKSQKLDFFRTQLKK